MAMMRSAHSAAWGNEVPGVLLESSLESAVCAHIIVKCRVLILKALAVDEFRIAAECVHDFRMGRTELVKSLQVSHWEIARGRTGGGNLDLSSLCKSLLVTGKQSRDKPDCENDGDTLHTGGLLSFEAVGYDAQDQTNSTRNCGPVGMTGHFASLYASPISYEYSNCQNPANVGGNSVISSRPSAGTATRVPWTNRENFKIQL